MINYTVNLSEKTKHHYLTELVILLMILANSCQSHKVNYGTDLSDYSQPDSITLKISAHNLTEDMSSISSKNDELTILIYELGNLSESANLIYTTSFVMTSASNIKKLSWPNNIELKGKSISILILERDTDQSHDEIVNSIGHRYFEIANFYKVNGNYKIDSIIGDNDIIGIKTLSDFEKQKIFTFEFRGYFKLDKYEYSLQLETIQNKK